MADTIGSLVIDLVANTTSFATQLNSAVKAVEDTVSKMKSAFGGLATIFSIAGIADLTKDTLAFGDQLQKATAQTGLSATAISELSFAAKQANIDLPQLVSTFDKMEKSISDATTGTGVSKAAFDALGISLSQLKTLSPDQQFEEIANQISALPSPIDKARAAMDIFGRSGAELLPLFEKGAAGIEEARQKAVDFGASLSSDQLTKLATANTAVNDLGASFHAMALTLGADVAPALTAFFNSINAMATPATKLEALEETMGALTETGNSDAVQQLQKLIDVTKAQTQAAAAAKAAADAAKAAASNAPASAPPGFLAPIQPVDITAQKLTTDAMTKFYTDLDDATKTGAQKVLDDTQDFQSKLDLLVKDGQISVSDSFNRSNAASDASSMTDLLTSNAVAIQSSYKQTQDDLAADFKGISDSAVLAGKNSSAAWNEMVENAKSSAQSIQDAFATFLVDPFDGGLKKMLASWASTLEQMAAKAEAQQIFRSIFGNAGLAGVFQSFFTGGTTTTAAAATGADTGVGFTPFATGGSFGVGGSGGTDSQLIQFKATPGEMVNVQTPGQAAASAMPAIHFSPTYNIGAGVSRSDVVSACAATQKSTIAQMTMLIRGGAYA